MDRGSRWLVLAVLTILTGGICLSLWLVLSLLERQTERQMVNLEGLADRVIGPRPDPEAPVETTMMSPAVTEDVDLPLWAAGMTMDEYEEMMAEGFDPVTGRVLEL